MNTNEDTSKGNTRVIGMVQANSNGIGASNNADEMGGFKEATTSSNHSQPFAYTTWY